MPPSWVGALAQLENMEKENHDAAMVAKSRSRIRGHEEEVRAPWYLFGLGSLLTHRLFLDSIVVSIPACHAGDRGSIPRRGGRRLFLCSLLLLSLLSSSPFPPLSSSSPFFSSSSPLFPSSPFFPVGETRLFWFVWCFVVCFGLVLVVCVVVVFFVVGVLLSTVCWFGFVGCVVCCVLWW